MRERRDVNRLGFYLVWPVSLVLPVSRAMIVFPHPAKYWKQPTPLPANKTGGLYEARSPVCRRWFSRAIPTLRRRPLRLARLMGLSLNVAAKLSSLI